MHGRAINNDKPFLPDVPLHQDPFHKPSSLQQNTNKISQNPNINLDFEGKLTISGRHHI